MTHDQIVADICGRMNLVSDEAKARVGQAVNRHYRRVTATVGLEPVRYVTRTGTTALDSDTVVFTGIEKIDRVFERGTDGIVRTLKPVSVAQLRQATDMQGDRSMYAVWQQSADTVTILLPGLALAVTDLYADGWTTLADMSGADKPTLPESFHDILTFAVVAEEYLRKEKTDLADRFARDADVLLKELRFHIADAPPIDWRQGGHVVGGESGGGSGGSGGSVITGDIIFDRDPGPPFTVTPGSGLVENLDADKLDGQHGAFYQDASNLNAGTIDPARLPPTVPLLHHTAHEPGGADALVALSAGIINQGTLDSARLADGAVPFAKLPNVTALHLLGRGDSGAGPAQEITLGTGLSMVGTVLNGTATAIAPEEVFVGPSDPGDPVELWFDTDAVPPPASAATIISRGLTLAGAITTGLKGIVRLPFAAQVLGWSVMADVACSIAFDVAVNAPGTYPPVTSIVAAAPPTLAAQSFASDAALSGWTVNLNAGDVMAFRVSSVTGTPGFVTLQLDLIPR